LSNDSKEKKKWVSEAFPHSRGNIWPSEKNNWWKSEHWKKVAKGGGEVIFRRMGVGGEEEWTVGKRKEQTVGKSRKDLHSFHVPQPKGRPGRQQEGRQEDQKIK